MPEVMSDPTGVSLLGVGMIVLSLCATLVPLLIVAFVLYRVFGGMKRAGAERERLLGEGVSASATVLNLSMGGMTTQVGVQRHLQVQLQVEVQPPDRAAWQAPLVTMISELQIPQLQPGARLQVRYDPADPSRLALEGLAGAGGGVLSQGSLPLQAPDTPSGMSSRAKIGLAIGAAGCLIGLIAALVGAAAAGVAVFGLGASTGERDTTCDRAIRCCRALNTDDAEMLATCSALGTPGLPENVCRDALQGFEETAAALEITCE